MCEGGLAAGEQWRQLGDRRLQGCSGRIAKQRPPTSEHAPGVALQAGRVGPFTAQACASGLDLNQTRQQRAHCPRDHERAFDRTHQIGGGVAGQILAHRIRWLSVGVGVQQARGAQSGGRESLRQHARQVQLVARPRAIADPLDNQPPSILNGRDHCAIFEAPATWLGRHHRRPGHGAQPRNLVRIVCHNKMDEWPTTKDEGSLHEPFVLRHSSPAKYYAC
jgi:hypothetical protein